MAKRRGNNEGTIHQRQNGTWRAQITLDGHRLSFTASTRNTCQQWLKNTVHQIDEGMNFASTVKTLGEFLNNWLDSSCASMQRTTSKQYHQVSRSYIIPYIGKIKIKDLRPDQIQHFYDILLKRGLGIYAILKTHTVLRSALSHAQKLGIINRNPASVVITPKEQQKEMKILDETQVGRLLLSVKNHRWEALYHLAIVTGMRQMELLGLKWTDIDWINRSLKVERQLLRSNSKQLMFSQTKTRYGKRTLTLGMKSIEILKAHYERQHISRRTAGEKWSEQGLIFTNNIGGAISHRNLLRDFKHVLANAGLPHIRFHDLRHTAASLMLNHGIAPIIVSRRLGHAKPSITLDIYGHLIPSMQSEAAELIDDVITPIEINTTSQNCTQTAPELHPQIINR